jgi:hypothetical protein
MHIPQKLLQIIGVLALAALLQACSAVKLAYNQAPELLYWEMDSYLDFSETQSLKVREDLAKLQQWHRSTQLPQYADLLQRVRQQMPDAITPAQACLTFNEVRSKVDAVFEYAQPSVVALVTQFSEDQIKHLERKQATGNADWKKEWLTGTPQELLERRYKQALSRSEMIYGSLDEAQKAVLRSSVQESGFDAQVSYTERLRRQQDSQQVLRQIVSQKLSVQQAQTLMRGYLDRSLQSPNPAHQRYAQAMIQEGCISFARLHNATTVAQRAKAAQNLKNYEDDFKALAAQR